MTDCVVCEQPIQGRRRVDSVCCVGECSKELARRRTKAWKKGEKLKFAPIKSTQAENSRRSNLRRHGVPEDLVHAVMRNGNIWACEACGRLSLPQVDHDHNHCPGVYGCVICFRGLLCRDCNLASGILKDSPIILRQLAEYLENHPLNPIVLLNSSSDLDG